LPRFAVAVALAGEPVDDRQPELRNPLAFFNDDTGFESEWTSSTLTFSSSLSSTLAETHHAAAPVFTTVVVRRTISRAEAQQRLDALRRRGSLVGTKLMAADFSGSRRK
jgi:hypothetical protein